MKLQIGRTYDVSSYRKGNFQFVLTSQNEGFATGTVVKGVADALLEYNKSYIGDSVSVRKEHSIFTLID